MSDHEGGGLRFRVKRARRGLLRRPQWRVYLVAGNHETLMWSETLTNRVDAIAVVDMIREHAAHADVEVEA